MSRKHPAGLKRLAKHLERKVVLEEYTPDRGNMACAEGGDWDEQTRVVTPRQHRLGNIDEDFDELHR